jgi:hypothetical protein
MLGLSEWDWETSGWDYSFHKKNTIMAKLFEELLCAAEWHDNIDMGVGERDAWTLLVAVVPVVNANISVITFPDFIRENILHVEEEKEPVLTCFGAITNVLTKKTYITQINEYDSDLSVYFNDTDCDKRKVMINHVVSVIHSTMNMPRDKYHMLHHKHDLPYIINDSADLRNIQSLHQVFTDTSLSDKSIGTYIITEKHIEMHGHKITAYYILDMITMGVQIYIDKTDLLMKLKRSGYIDQEGKVINHRTRNEIIDLEDVAYNVITDYTQKGFDDVCEYDFDQDTWHNLSGEC